MLAEFSRNKTRLVIFPLAIRSWASNQVIFKAINASEILMSWINSNLFILGFKVVYLNFPLPPHSVVITN